MYTKEKLKHWGLMSAMLVASISAATLLGFGTAYVGYVATLFLVAPAMVLISHIDITKLSQFASLNQIKDPNEKQTRLLNLFAENKKAILPTLALLGFNIAVPVVAYIQSGSIMLSALLIGMQIVVTKIGSRIKNVDKIDLINQFSTSRPLNPTINEEAKLNKILKEICLKNNLALPKVTYVDIFANVNNSNFDEFRNEVSRVMPKLIIKNLSNEQLLAKAKERVLPNMYATQSILDGNHITVYSSVFKHKVKLTSAEIKAVLSHELGHHASNDSFKGLLNKGLYLTTAILGLTSLRAAGLALFAVAHLASTYFSKTCEINADLFSVQKGNSKGLMSSFNKFDSFSEKIKKEDKSQDENQTLFQKAKGYYNEWAEEHPATADRIAIIKRYEESKETLKAHIPSLA